MSTGKRYSKEEKEEILRYRTTHTYQETVTQYGVSQMTLARWSHAFKDIKPAEERVSGDSSFSTLLSVIKYLEGVKAVAIINDNGELVADMMDPDINEDVLLYITIPLLGLWDRTNKDLGLGNPQMMITKNANGIMIIMSAGKTALLSIIFSNAVEISTVLTQHLSMIDRVREDIIKKLEY